MDKQKGSTMMFVPSHLHNGDASATFNDYEKLASDPEVTTYAYLNPHIGIVDHHIWDSGYGGSMTIPELEKSANTGCKVCSIVFDGLNAFQPYPQGLPDTTQVTWTEYWRGDKPLNVQLRPEEFEIALELEYYVEDQPWRVFGASQSVPHHSDHEKCFLSMRRWLDDCKVNHPRCQPSGPPSSLPSRLIDIGRSNSNINLIEVPETTNVEYLSLSHCWGKRQIITTTHATLTERKRNIRWDLLSKTFQDSITTTRRLGYQYIWIDSLCIIQDDKADWEIESAKMADIYENSVLTLSANTAEDGDGGCFANRYQLEKDGTRYEVESTELKYDNVDGRPLSVFVRRPLTSIEWENEKMPLFDRAWTFQERMLARRVLHFNNRELVWECDTMKKCECGAHDELWEEVPDWKEPRRPRILTTEYAKSSTWSKMPLQQQQIDQWRSLTLKYGGKALTYGSDKLPALSGVAKRAKIQGKGKYLAGIWEVELPEGLIWDLCTPLSSRAAVDPNIQRATYRAPTWSWASIEGSAYVVHEEGVDYKYHAKVLEADCTPKGLDPTGEVMDGHIILSAPFTQITIDLRKDPDGVHIGGTGYHYQSFALDGHQTWVLFQNHHDPTNLLTQDEAAMRFVEPYKPLFCVKVRTRELDPPRAEIKRYFVTDSLLLKRSERVEGAYERLGVAKFQAADEWDAFENAEMAVMRIV